MRTQDSATATTTIAVTTTGGTLGAAATDFTRGATAADPAGPGTTGASAGRTDPLPRGTLLAALGVISFSLTFPSTVWGLESFGPWSLVAVRSTLAALIAGAFLLVGRVPLPERRHWAGLAVVAGGVVIGFPLLTTLALQT
ncbi:EamA family transporter, partial [Corallococcus exiguus]